MNKFNETKTRPSYSYKIQRLTNGLPSWTKARQDKHSNYQSVLSDLNEQIEELTYYAKLSEKRQRLILSDVQESGNIFRYWDANVPATLIGNTTVYTAPVSVEASADLIGSNVPLVKCPYPDVEDLNNRIDLEYKDLTETTIPYDVISVNEDNTEWLIYIKRDCFLGFEFTPVGDYTISPEDFYVKQNGVYVYNIAYLYTYFNTPSQGVRILPELSHNFLDPVTPGMYYLKFDMLSPDLLANFTISIVANNAFSKSAKIEYHDIYADEILGADSYLRVDDDSYLQVVVKDYEGNRTDQVPEAYLLLNAEDEAASIQSWCKKEKMIYALDADGTTLYMYDTFQDGNAYVYENNTDYILDIVCEKIDYKTGDEITLEVRSTYVIPQFKIRELRMKVENYEGSESYYINNDGDHVTDGGAWRAIEEQVIKWKFNIDNLGSYRFTLEVLDENRNIITAGVKLILVNYKAPYKVFNLSGDFNGWQLGVNPDNKVELVSPEGDTSILNFHKDGYFFDEVTGFIWTNVFANQLIVEY